MLSISSFENVQIRFLVLDLDAALERNIFTMRLWEMTRGLRGIYAVKIQAGERSIVRGYCISFSLKVPIWGDGLVMQLEHA